ncbi:MAG: DVU0150 family protein [Candidatus Korobacteraceae bacterium]|jgi:hypothetical protein
MTKYFSRLLGLITVLLLLPTQLFAAGGADMPDLMVLVADTRKYKGWEAWWGNIYNEGHVAFALITVIIIPLAGVILGLLADVVMSRIGIDLKSRALAEH